MEKLRLALLGADLDLRAALIPYNMPKDRSVLTVVADRNPAMLDKFRERLPEESKNIFFTTSNDELFRRKDVDACCIMVRDKYHEELACRALEAGFAVYLEKPIALTVEGADRILETAYRTGSKLFLGHNMRYMPFVVKMKEIIDSGVIGKVQAAWCRHFVNYGSCYFRDWCSEQENVNGLLLQKGAHDIDVIQWLTGGVPRLVSGMGMLSVYNQTKGRLSSEEALCPDRKKSFTEDCWPPLELTGLQPKIDIEDHNMIMMQMDNGVQACYMHCMYAPDSERNYTFIGTHGRVENHGNGEEGTKVMVWTSRGSCMRPDIVYDLRPRSGGHGGADTGIVPSFVDFVREGKVPATSPVDARNAVAAGCGGHYSMRHGCVPVEIPPLREELVAYFAGGQKKK